MRVCRSKWTVPATALALGLMLLGAEWAGGHPGLGFEALGVMTVTGAVFLFGGRSETIRGLRGDGSDERFREIDVHATAIAGFAVIVAVIVAFVVEIARGHSGAPYDWLGAIAGLTYIAAIIALRLRG
jgi:hypothetical protein